METNKEQSALLNLLVRSAELIEEIYSMNPELIHDDHAQDYSDIIAALHQHNIFFRANPKISQMAHDYNPLKSFGKMPMEKAKRTKPAVDDDKRNAI